MSRSPNWKIPFALSILLLGVGTLAYWYEFSAKPKKETEETQSKRLFKINDGEVTSIVIRDLGTRYVFKCLDAAEKRCKPSDNSKWEIAEPVKLRADDANISSLVSTLNNMEPTETIDLKEEEPKKRLALLEEYRLDPANRKTIQRVEVTYGANESTTVYFGDIHPLGESYYALAGKGVGDEAQLDETKVYLVPTYIKANFGKDLTHWRDKKVLTIASHEIANFDLKNPKGTVRGTRKDSQWVLTAGNSAETYAGDVESIDSMITSATLMSAKSFPANKKDSPEGKKALAGARASTTLYLAKEDGKDASSLAFYTKGKPERVLLTVSNLDPVFEVDAPILERLKKELKDLRMSKLISAIERFNFKRFEFSSPGLGATPLLISGTSGNWRQDNSSVVAADLKVQHLLDRLSGNRIQAFLPAAQIPQGENQGIRLDLGDDKNPKMRSFVFWKSGKKAYARDLMSSRKEAYQIEMPVYDALPAARDFFVEKAKGAAQ